MRKAALVVGGIGVYVGGVALASNVLTKRVAERQEARAVSDAERRATFNAQARIYDAEIGGDEIAMGLPLLRRFLLRHAAGHVLEVASGTGRNLAYYRSPPVASVTLVDTAPAMLEVAREKAPAGLDVALLEGDAQRLAFASGSFDTVVDTFGLCSVDDPVEALRELQRVTKPGGRILLLEHGRAHYEWLCRILDQNAAAHAERWGCWWNRPIEDIVAEAGLVVETSYRVHFGTTHYINAAAHAERWGCWWNRPIEDIVAEAGLVVETSYRVHTHDIVARVPSS